jgi:hypothetical protein
VSLDKAESVSIVYPVNEKRGKTVLVPLHLRACTKNPFEIDTQILVFRHMRQSTQEREREKWRAMKQSEKASFKQHLAFLVELKGRILRGEVIWSEVAKPVLGPDDMLKQAEATRRANRKKRKTTPSNKDPPRAVTPLPESESDQNLTLGDANCARSTAAVESGPTGDAIVNTPPPPPPPPPLAQTMRPIVRTEEQYTVMLGDSIEVRSQEATKQRKKAKSNNAPRREKGSGTTKVYQRADAVSNDAIRFAEAQVALAAETIRPQSEHAYQGARRAFLSIDVNWCRDSRAVGGSGFVDAECTREKPAVTIVGASNKEELVWVLVQVMKALKHSDESDVREFATREALEAHAEAEKLARGQPSKTPVSGDTFLANRHNNRVV